MATIVDLRDAETNLSQLVEMATYGVDVIVSKDGKPVARLVAYTFEQHPRKPGALKGRIRIGVDFDAPLPPNIAKPPV